MAKKKEAAPKKAGGRRKAQKETKEEKVDVSEGLSLLIGHNDPPNRDLVYHLETIAGLQSKVKAAQAKVSDAKKKAKEAGVDMNAVALTLKALNMDVLDLATMMRQQMALFREKGLPVQLSLYETKYDSVEDQASVEGYQDGLNGKNPNLKRWPDGAQGSVAYMRRWNDAQAELVSKMGGKETAH